MSVRQLSRDLDIAAIVSTQARDINATSSNEQEYEVDMAEYQDILTFLASNPPQLEPEKRFHASLLELLAKKLRCGADVNSFELLKKDFPIPNSKKGYH